MDQEQSLEFSQDTEIKKDVELVFQEFDMGHKGYLTRNEIIQFIQKNNINSLIQLTEE